MVIGNQRLKTEKFENGQLIGKIYDVNYENEE